MARSAEILLSLAPLLLFLMGCSPNSGSVGPSNTLLRGLGPEPDSLDPQRAASVEAQTVLRDLCEGLTTLDTSAGVSAGVAQEFAISPDGKTYTFHLREGARWSTGERVVAADFVAAFRRLADPKTGSKYQQFVAGISHAQDVFERKAGPDALGIQALDEKTLVIELSSPKHYFLQLLAHPSTCPVHRPTLNRYGAKYARAGILVSNGAFVLKEWVPGAYISLERNRYYWNDAATRLRGVEYFFVANANDELTRYRAGELHITSGVSRAQFDWVRKNLGRELHLSPQLGTYFYGFNLERSPFKDHTELRRALSLAIDREQLVNAILRAGEVPAYEWIPLGVSGYRRDHLRDVTSSDKAQRVQAARRLYAQAGYSAANPLRVELRYNNGETHTQLAIAIASMWREALGVEVKLTAEEFASLLEDIGEGKVELFRSSWIADYTDAYSFLQFFESGSGVNLTRYHNPVYDNLLAHAQMEGEPERRAVLLARAEALINEDQPIIPIYYYVNKHLVKPSVRGWYESVLGVVYSKDLSLSAP